MGQVAIGPDGMLVSTTQGPQGARLVLWRPGMKVRIVNGSFGTFGAWVWISASREMGLWSAEHSRYTLRRHTLPSGAVDFEIHRRVEWFPSQARYQEYDESAPILIQLTVDERGLLWVWTVLPDPDAPSAPRPLPESPVELDLEIVSRYREEVDPVDQAVLDVEPA